jgi:putative ABC transport system substrate-binding protein
MVAAMVIATMLPTVADAQPATRIYRIGWLSDGTVAEAAAGADFQQGLRDLGRVDKQNVVVSRHANGNTGRLPELAAELARLNVDVIVTTGEAAALAAKNASLSIPIVATEFGFDPVKAGLVTSLGRPGGNVTGLSSISEELWEKRLALLREIVPRMTRIAILWNPSNLGNATCLSETQAAARAMGLQLRLLEVRDGKALERVLADFGREPVDGIATCWDPVTLAHAALIADFALKRRLPSVAPLREYVQAGSLLSFGSSLPAHRRRAAYYVDKILKGTKPVDLPVERPTHFELVVNLSTARALGLTLPPTLVVLADEIIP